MSNAGTRQANSAMRWLPAVLPYSGEFCQKLELALDAPLNLSIIRPSSGADQTENSLVNK
jgi:hypothetical protein